MTTLDVLCANTLLDRSPDGGDSGSQGCFVLDLKCVGITVFLVDHEVNSGTNLARDSQALDALRHQ
jgi:hypothetical protein